MTTVRATVTVRSSRWDYSQEARDVVATVCDYFDRHPDAKVSRLTIAEKPMQSGPPDLVARFLLEEHR